MSGEFIFLASPYSDRRAEVRNERYLGAVKASAYLVRAGMAVYSPIAFWHPIAEIHSMPGDAAYWLEQNRAFIEKCDRLYLLMLDGWEKSVGVCLEVAMARALDKQIIQFPPIGE